MKKIILLGLVLTCWLMSSTVAEAQKYAYVTSGSILEKMPEMEQMRSNLDGYRSQLQKKGQKMVEDFQLKQQDASAKKERGELAPVQEQKILEELQKMQEDIINYEQEMQNMMLAKQEELLAPVLEKINTAIKEIAKEDGYTLVFDLSSGAILFADENSDITAKVKAKVGIVEE
ncbi:MAG: OmpH family outer membrane protein [Saprospiraceae bacterium]